jgi:hypothetical protein
LPDNLEIVELSKQSDSLVTMVTKKSTLDDDVQSETEMIAESLNDDPMVIEDSVFDENVSQASGKHSLSPTSADAGPPGGKWKDLVE